MRISRGLMFLAVVLALWSCGPRDGTAGEAGGVLAAETFLADIAQNVAGERLEVGSLLAPGFDPHEFQATPRDAVRLAEARVLIINGRGYESWLEKSLSASGQTTVVEASAGLPAGPHSDPHLWMNPGNVVRYVENIRLALADFDPAGASTYAANSRAYIEELQALDAWIAAQVAALPADRRVLVTNHHALEAFAEAYGFEIAGVVIPGYSSSAASSARGLTDLIEIIKARRVPAIFLDISENPDLARQIGAESGARVVTGLYVETLSDAEGPAATYIDLMKYDVGLIIDALR